jgi:hypothetical protein
VERIISGATLGAMVWFWLFSKCPCDIPHCSAMELSVVDLAGDSHGCGRCRLLRHFVIDAPTTNMTGFTEGAAAVGERFVRVKATTLKQPHQHYTPTTGLKNPYDMGATSITLPYEIFDA